MISTTTPLLNEKGQRVRHLYVIRNAYYSLSYDGIEWKLPNYPKVGTVLQFYGKAAVFKEKSGGVYIDKELMKLMDFRFLELFFQMDKETIENKISIGEYQLVKLPN